MENIIKKTLFNIGTCIAIFNVFLLPSLIFIELNSWLGLFIAIFVFCAYGYAILETFNNYEKK